MVSCRYCSTELPDGALFCGECGRVLQPTPVSGARSMIPPPLTRPLSEPQSGGGAAGATDACAQCGAPLAPDDIFCGECGFVAHPLGATGDRPRDTNVVERIEAVQEEAPQEEAPQEDTGDLEPTRIVTHRLKGARFVLQFSTGESFTVFGTGLVGRNPRPEPGEYFDELIRVLDPTRSVSKTHLEFGQETGAFWIKDRFSGNGTIVREPEAAPLHCRPDRRYRLARGSRVDMGEQFFIVS